MSLRSEVEKVGKVQEVLKAIFTFGDP